MVFEVVIKRSHSVKQQEAGRSPDPSRQAGAMEAGITGGGGVWVSSLTSSAEVLRSAGAAVSSTYCDGSTWQTHQYHLKVNN